MVYTNPEYRGQKICQTNIEYIINLTKKYIKTYELKVDVDNIAALKCYENNGFKKIREYETKDKKILYSFFEVFIKSSDTIEVISDYGKNMTICRPKSLCTIAGGSRKRHSKKRRSKKRRALRKTK
jgi:hypothetical protein